jgi:hypothetical protein
MQLRLKGWEGECPATMREAYNPPLTHESSVHDALRILFGAAVSGGGGGRRRMGEGSGSRRRRRPLQTMHDGRGAIKTADGSGGSKKRQLEPESTFKKFKQHPWKQSDCSWGNATENGQKRRRAFAE